MSYGNELSKRVNPLLSLNRTLHYSLSTSRECVEIVVSKDRNLGAFDNIHEHIFGFGYRGFTSRLLQQRINQGRRSFICHGIWRYNSRRESVEEKIARHEKDGRVTSREIAVQFNADVADGMPWKFIPTQREVRVKPGESALAFYTAENQSSTPITGVSTYNVIPMKVYVYKIRCQCILTTSPRSFQSFNTTFSQLM
ncbi:hypothetical protein K7X08_006586 [Anisodus acutangulus]|uniref:Uncharacterized protein n=1 Tax=Anisodus acutangulus TaxID=402998 RepID=A0A9Q1MVM3_9SOLA|nr:hypothetical protein K7X08_006586 [Anisodus acutangulus]